MKLSVAFLSGLMTLVLPSHALVGVPWSMTNVPATGLNHIAFPITLLQADHISGYYFAMQYAFVNSGIGYTGIQPRPDSSGQPVLHGVFSSFIAGTTSTDPNCSNGADGGAGVSCKFEWNGVYDHKYDYEVRFHEQSGYWNGTAVDTVTGDRFHIGSYKLPAGAGGIKGSQLGFVEWFPWNNREPPDHCAKLPYQKTRFGHPHTENPGSVGKVSLPYLYGDCNATQVAFHSNLHPEGVEDNCGWMGQTGF